MLGRPDKRDLEDALMELADVDIAEDNLDFSQVDRKSYRIEGVYKLKYRIRETLILSTCADSSTNTIFFITCNLSLVTCPLEHVINTNSQSHRPFPC